MTGSFVIKKNRILEILFFIIIFLVNLKMTLNISNFATANLSILIIGSHTNRNLTHHAYDE